MVLIQCINRFNFKNCWKKVKVAQSWPTLCDPTDCTVHGILQARILEWVAFPFSRVGPRSPALQADSLPAEPQQKSKNTAVVSLYLLQWIFPTQEWNWGLLHCRQGSPLCIYYKFSNQNTTQGVTWGQFQQPQSLSPPIPPRGLRLHHCLPVTLQLWLFSWSLTDSANVTLNISRR